MIKRVKNDSGVDKFWGGLFFSNLEERDLTDEEVDTLFLCANFPTALSSGDAKVSNGTTYLSAAEGDDYLKMIRSGGHCIGVNEFMTVTNSTDTGAKGQICFDANYIYVCVDTDTWKRVALSTW
jgi:hypothetical protein